MTRQKDPLFKEMLQNTWATFAYFFSQWLLTIIITRFSGYDDAGTFSLAVSFTNIFGFISKFGMRSLQVGDISRQYSDGQYFTSRVLTSICSIFPFVITLTISNYRPELAASCVAMMSYKLLESFDDVITGTMQRSHHYNWIALSYTLKAVLTLVTFSALLLSGLSLPICIWGMSLAYLCVLVFYDFHKLSKSDFFKWSTKGIKTLITQCGPLVTTSLLDAIIIYLPRNAVEQVCGADELGYYGTVSIVVVVLSTFAGAIWGSVLSRYSELIQNQRWNDFGRFTAIIVVMLSLASAFVMMLGNLIGPFFFRLFFGEEILLHMDLLPPVLANAVLLLLTSFFTCIFVPLRRRNILMTTNIIAVAVCAISAIPCTVHMGTIGASISLMIALIIRCILLIGCAIICVKQAKRNHPMIQ